jgi:hypothetical protein
MDPLKILTYSPSIVNNRTRNPLCDEKLGSLAGQSVQTDEVLCPDKEQMMFFTLMAPKFLDNKQDCDVVK